MDSYSEAELKEYGQCLERIFGGGHTAGLASCPYCAEIYRRYHNVSKPTRPVVEEEREVCECCEGHPTSCQSEGCAQFGVCLACSVENN